MFPLPDKLNPRPHSRVIHWRFGWLEQMSTSTTAFEFARTVLSGVIISYDPIPQPDFPGDYNGDHKVDAADYVVWRKNEGTNNMLPNDNMIGGTIGQAHYDLWRANFGMGAGAGSGSIQSDGASVPEPGSCVSAAILALVLLGRRDRRIKC